MTFTCSHACRHVKNNLLSHFKMRNTARMLTKHRACHSHNVLKSESINLVVFWDVMSYNLIFVHETFRKKLVLSKH